MTGKQKKAIAVDENTNKRPSKIGRASCRERV